MPITTIAEQLRRVQKDRMVGEKRAFNEAVEQDLSLVDSQMKRVPAIRGKLDRAYFTDRSRTFRERLGALTAISLLDSFGSREEAVRFLRAEQDRKNKRIDQITEEAALPESEFLMEFFRPFMDVEDASDPDLQKVDKKRAQAPLKLT